MKKKVVSAAEVAKLANVSQSTVSRVFTPGASVSEKTKEKVLKVANKMNYYPNALARSLITQKTNIIGLAMKDIQNPFYHEVLGAFTKKLRAKGFFILFVYTENEEIQQEEINHFLEYNVEAIIVTDALLSSKLVDQFQDHNIPVIFFNRYDKNSHFNSVICDNINAATEIASYVYNQGYSDIVYITGKVNTSTNRDRQKGFTDFLITKGIDVKILEGNYTYKRSFQMTKELIESDHKPELIFGANDITALGALDALKVKNIQVPDETAVIGFDDIRMSSWPNYSLTTWAQPIEQMIDETIKLLTIHPTEGNESVKVKGHFIRRKTTI